MSSVDRTHERRPRVLDPAALPVAFSRGGGLFLVTYSALALLFGLGCPEQVSGDEGAPSLGACAEVGQRCEVSPGKLGSCVLIDGCRQGSCYVCQSQH